MSKKKKHPQNVTYTEIGPDDRIEFFGRPYRFDERLEEGVVLKSDDDRPQNTIVLAWSEIREHIHLDQLVIERHYFSKESAIKRAAKRSLDKLREDVALKTVAVRQFLEELEEGTLTKSDDDIKQFLRKFRLENASLIEKADDGSKKRGNKKRGIVSPRQFRRWVKDFQSGNRSDASLVWKHRGRVGFGSGFSAEELKYFGTYIREYLSENVPNMWAAYSKLARDHAQRKLADDKTVRLCSYGTFRRMVKAMDEFVVKLARDKDHHLTTRQHAISRKGLQPRYPLHIVEMDEQNIDLMVICEMFGFWDLLDLDIQDRIKKIERVWICVALDAYSRSILGMRVLAGAPCAAESIATLAMAVRDKEYTTALSQEVIEWPQCGVPDRVHTDAGAGFANDEFPLVVQALTGKHAIPPSKHPHLRSRVERFFQSLSTRYMHFFSGQTFGNILLKGQYKPEKHAHITREMLCELLVQLIVVCYHNTPHRSLSGETPLERWYRGSQQERAVPPPPTVEQYRDIFGIRLIRRIGRRGITILGNTYASRELDDLVMHKLNCEVEVRLNDRDMWAISFKDPRDDNWYDAYATFEGFKGVSVLEWMETVIYLRKKFGASAPGKERARQIVADALAAVEKTAEQTRLAHDIGGPLITDKTIKNFERKNMMNWRWSKHLYVDFADPSQRPVSGGTTDPVASFSADDPMNPTGIFDLDVLEEPNDKRTANDLPQKTKPKTTKNSASAGPSVDDDDELDIGAVNLRVETKE
ncbi:transposase [bacterium M00.F.Ca.ET.194.01.1.1]|uniref:DDE-type integrase/transposase/recombinase n=1 Tax=Agrobacterium pusense TaxID=648995 RepID=UPI001091CE44|nr:DDE-type integrase/transposase/recombinase [Agrobacterium pusense]TGR72420.1 transposase [bacterium M00.F.Ca.ET.194.01.1.1]TGS57321.1 transposase [bacterium M00.F.Ca.ET.179.01.1.1]TGV50252.1 transposase [bacterium M00.F.Ca.ET.168.01.1.1]